ncbi:very-short-patch-repair endonuclease [Kribbella aluminosa]|uniref:Very-short-patch-repair endonuclease n=1 Tax=Kribbella aluminosa TaxID=416017 RepID=A0ABS4UE35_9ACTN|nr:hypothetical protein [Kribbella aluminosa]MBP2349878.1 very-short-patch-repair endonuclease [Kribbella aluminosa]
MSRWPWRTQALPPAESASHRYDEMVAAGWLVLRFTYEQVVGDPAWVVATVRAALARRLAG